jgi:glycosyltransferase involved in cell wall biosynthesis
MMRAGSDGSMLFTGPLPHHEVSRHLAAMDIVTVPDFNDYGCPIKIFEYMAMGKPLIAPRVPSIAEIVTHGQDGWLMEKSSTRNLMGAIEYLNENPRIRQQLGLGARQTVLQKFTWSKIAEQLDSVLENASVAYRNPKALNWIDTTPVKKGIGETD